MKKFLLLISIFSSSHLFAQEFIELNLKAYQPIGELNENITQAPFGLSLGYSRSLNSKFSVGANLGVAMYSSDMYNVQTPGGQVRVEEEDCFITAHLNSRYFLKGVAGISPYLEGRIGITTFFSTKTSIERTPNFDDTFDVHGTAFNSALGIGLLTDFKQIFKNEPGSVLVSMGMNYHTGSKATYRNFKKADSSISSPQADTFKSLTDYIDYKLGVAFRIN